MSRPRKKPMTYSLPKENGFATSISTNTNDEYPKVVYMRTKVRLTPTVKQKTYETDILNLKKEFETQATKIINHNRKYERKYIFSLNLAEKSVKYNKNSHMHYDIFLRPRERMTLLENKEALSEMSTQLDETLTGMLDRYNIKTY